MEKYKRDSNIDILRFIGLMLIILSHASPSPNFIMQIRCFDVPMMLFISGLTCANKDFPYYFQFVKKRTERLITPVYIFLIAYFIFLIIVQSLGYIPQILTIRKAIESFLLLDGIGYVWIIRVFLLIMLVTPILCKVGKLSNSIVLLIIVSLILVCDSIVYLLNNYTLPDIMHIFIKDYLVYTIAYSAPFLLGYKLRYSDTKSNIFWVTFCTILMLLGLCLYIKEIGYPISISPQFKYPPQSYFIIYGMFCSVVLWISKKWWIKLLDCRLTQFIGQNTIWIYLWHIPFVALLLKTVDSWYIRYIILVCIPSVMFFVQYKIVNNTSILNKYKNYLIG